MYKYKEVCSLKQLVLETLYSYFNKEISNSIDFIEDKIIISFQSGDRVVVEVK